MLERVLEGEQDAIAAERFFEEVECAGASGFDGVGDGGVAGDHDGGRGDVAALHVFQQIDAAAVGEADVEDEDVGAAEIGELLELADGAEGVHGVALALEDHAEGAADVFFVVNDQDAFVIHDCPFLGSTTRKPAPPSSPATRSKSPPVRRAHLRAMERPRPMPRFLKEMVGWNRDLRASSLRPGPESWTSTTIWSSSIGSEGEDTATGTGGFGCVLEQVD